LESSCGPLKPDVFKSSLTTLAEMGVALLLFSMGLEFDKDDLKPIKKIAIYGTL